MGYGCLICAKCLEADPSDDTAIERPAEAAGSGGAAQATSRSTEPAQTAAEPLAGPSRVSRGSKNIRNGAPADLVVTRCGHLFHRFCIVRILKGKNQMNCPSCRKLCPVSGIVQIFPTVLPDAVPVDSSSVLLGHSNTRGTSAGIPIIPNSTVSQAQGAMQEVNAEGDDATIILKLSDDLDRQFHYRVKMSTKLGHVKKMYAEQVHDPIANLRFMFRGSHEVQNRDTPRELGMKNNDSIHVEYWCY